MDLILSNVPVRPDKPRDSGLTIVQDEGLSLKNIEDLISISGHLIDYVRIAPGALCSGEDLTKRVDTYMHAGISPFLSGIMFEAAYIRKRTKASPNNNITYIITDTTFRFPSKECATLSII